MELSEITGVEIVHKDKMLICILVAVVCQIIAVVGFVTPEGLLLGIIFEVFMVISILVGLLTIKNMLSVIFKGGYVTFPIKLYGFAKCNEFLRLTLLARKKYIEQHK